MKLPSSKTPLIAAFFLATPLLAALLSGCSQDKTQQQPAIASHCGSPTTAIARVQGDGPRSDMIGEIVDVQGIVTLPSSIDSFYIEEPDSDADQRTSNAIYLNVVDSGGHTGMAPGTRLVVRGTVTELEKGRNSLTALQDAQVLAVCSRGQELPLTSVQLPLKGLDREALEGMRVSLPQSLTITDNYRLSNAQLGVSGNGIQYTATELMPAGVAAADHALDNQAWTLPLQLYGIKGDAPAYAGGASFTNIQGVMAHDDRELRLTLSSMQEPMPAGSLSVAAPAAVADPNISRVVSMNLYNYFNGDGRGGDFPTTRGAKTFESFQKQRARIGAALKELQPQLIAVMELENDGFGPASATADLIDLLNQNAGGSWAAVKPENDNTGSDAIKVGLFYRSDLWQTEGSARTISGQEFKRSRQPLAQMFRPVNDGESLLLVVNHFKSKGSCPDSGPDADQRDGQGCWNATRTLTARKMTNWVKSIAAASRQENSGNDPGSDPNTNILIMGDMNAYRREAPIDAIRDAGFVELLDEASGQPFTFVYYGQAGTLDYAFANPALQNKVKNAFIWQVNSTMPAGIDLPQAWLRFSDHDPVVVDLALRH